MCYVMTQSLKFPLWLLHFLIVILVDMADIVEAITKEHVCWQSFLKYGGRGRVETLAINIFSDSGFVRSIDIG